MSNALAIATVTQTLVNVVTKAVADARVNGPHVSTLRPDDSDLQGAEATPRVNIFLYQVTPNTAWRNTDLPTRRTGGALIRRPTLALDLHYLFTFYGKDATLEHQRLLGAVARALFAQPALQRADVQSVEQMTDASNANVLYLDSHLSEQIDVVRFTPASLTLDDMSKLWAAFPQTNFVLSLAYIASVVLLETDDAPPAPALPVLKYQLRAFPLQSINIDSVVPQSIALAPAGITTIRLLGENLSSIDTPLFTTPGTTAPILGTFDTINSLPNTLSVKLPPTLHAGVNTIQLTQSSDTSPPTSPPGPTQLSQSNIMSFIVLPTIVSLTYTAGSLTLTLFPAVAPKQQVQLILNQLGGTLAYTLTADPHPNETSTLTFTTTFATGNVPIGTYLTQAVVDSASSRLTTDATGKFNGPTVTLS